MSLPSNYVGVDGDKCRCNRRASLRHCPSCGSFKVNFRRSQSGKSSTGHYIERFICSRCGRVFDDDDRKVCEAPTYLTKVQRAAADIARAQQAASQGGPLTKKEEVIVEAFPANELVGSQQTAQVSEDTLRRWKAEWTSSKIRGFMDKTLEEYIEQKLKEAGYV